ncbi:MAG: hypothetical protein ACRETN_03895 [Nevskiales bacterium]
MPATAAETESPGFFSRTWQSAKQFFGAAKEDSKDAGKAVGGVAVEGGRRAVNAGKAVGGAVVEGAKDVKDAVVTPSDKAEDKKQDAGQN